MGLKAGGLDNLRPIVNNELRRLAGASCNENTRSRCKPTELVREAYFKLTDQRTTSSSLTGLGIAAFSPTTLYWPNLCRYSIEVMNALTISALM